MMVMLPDATEPATGANTGHTSKSASYAARLRAPSGGKARVSQDDVAAFYRGRTVQAVVGLVVSDHSVLEMIDRLLKQLEDHTLDMFIDSNLLIYGEVLQEVSHHLMSKSGVIGYVASFPIPEVISGINSFMLGAQSVRPDLKIKIVWVSSWFDPGKEAEAANSLIDQGADVLTAHVDSPKVVIETAEHRGVFSTGYHANQSALAPKGYLTGAEWNWEVVYRDYVNKIQKGQPWDHLVRGGFKEGFIKMSPYGAAVSDATKAKADEAKVQQRVRSCALFSITFMTQVICSCNKSGRRNPG